MGVGYEISNKSDGIIVLLNSQTSVLLNFVFKKNYAERHLPHSFPYKVKRSYSDR